MVYSSVNIMIHTPLCGGLYSDIKWKNVKKHAHIIWACTLDVNFMVITGVNGCSLIATLFRPMCGIWVTELRYIYIYTEREGEREREWELKTCFVSWPSVTMITETQ